MNRYAIIEASLEANPQGDKQIRKEISKSKGDRQVCKHIKNLQAYKMVCKEISKSASIKAS